MAASITNTTTHGGLIPAGESIGDLAQQLRVFFVQYGLQIIGAVIIVVAGFLAARWLGAALLRTLQRREMEPPVRNLLVRLVRLVVVAFTFVLAAEKVGIPIAPLVAGIGVAGVGIGLATQGVLSNVVAGLTIIFTKPFRVGQYVEIAGVSGQVEAIELFSTVLVHGDLSRIIIPNRKIVGEILHNYSTVRQAEITVGIGYGSDVPRTLDLIREILKSHPLVLRSPEPVVGVSSLGESAVVLSIRPFVNLANFGAAQMALNQDLLDQLRRHQIEIPFPQREIRFLGPIPAPPQAPAA